ncbi:MAG: hypothetical protein U0610_27165 [bacterium]
METDSDAVRRLARRRYWREADARRVVDAWRRSEASAAAFARRYQLDPKRILRWAKDLDGPQPSAARFHPVRVVERGDPATVTFAPPIIEIVLLGGRRVRVPPGVDPSELRQILDVVEGAPAC